MPTSATGNSLGRTAEAGFSLVELMVVVFLMGLITGVVALNLPPGADGPEREAQRLAARLQLAAEEAVVTGDVLGFGTSALQYGFFRLERGQWHAIEGDRMFALTDWQDGLSAVVETGGLASAEESEILLRPVVRFDPVGGMTPFAITLEHENERVRVIGDAAGRIRIEETE